MEATFRCFLTLISEAPALLHCFKLLSSRPLAHPLSPFIHVILLHVLSILNEAFLILIFGVLAAFVSPEMTNSRALAIGSALIGIIVGLIVINWAIIVGYTIIDAKRKKRLKQIAMENEKLHGEHDGPMQRNHGKLNRNI